jgi:hypothetical protein
VRTGLGETGDRLMRCLGHQPREHPMGLLVRRVPRIDRFRLDREVGGRVQRSPVADLEDRWNIIRLGEANRHGHGTLPALELMLSMLMFRK